MYVLPSMPPKHTPILLFALFLIALSCNQSPEKSPEPGINLQEYGDTTFFNSFFRPKLDLMQLKDLRDGYDSLQLRVWFHSAFTDSADVFIIKKEPHQNWSSCKIRFPIEATTTQFGYEKINNTRGEEIWSKLKQSGIATFKGQDIHAMKRHCDGEIAIFEIATKSSYRICTSHSSVAYLSSRESEEEQLATTYMAYLYSIWLHPQ